MSITSDSCCSLNGVSHIINFAPVRPKKINSLSQLPTRIAFKIRFSAQLYAEACFFFPSPRYFLREFFQRYSVLFLSCDETRRGNCLFFSRAFTPFVTVCVVGTYWIGTLTICKRVLYGSRSTSPIFHLGQIVQLGPLLSRLL